MICKAAVATSYACCMGHHNCYGYKCMAWIDYDEEYRKQKGLEPDPLFNPDDEPLRETQYGYCGMAGK